MKDFVIALECYFGVLDVKLMWKLSILQDVFRLL